MMVRNLKSPARHQPHHFEIATVSDANDLFQVLMRNAQASNDPSKIGRSWTFSRLFENILGPFAVRFHGIKSGFLDSDLRHHEGHRSMNCLACNSLVLCSAKNSVSKSAFNTEFLGKLKNSAEK